MAHFEHGALSKDTKLLVDPVSAAKRILYECPDCKRDVFVRKGKIKIAHFAHKSDKNGSCTYFSRNPTKSQQHRNAQHKLKQFLERGIEIDIHRRCICGCNYASNWGVTYRPGPLTSIELEHGFQYNNTTNYADVAYIHDGKIVVIFEIAHTHFTHESRRPEPWHEILASEINETSSAATKIRLTCIRQLMRPECISRRKSERQRQVEFINQQREREIQRKKLEVEAEERRKKQRIEMDKIYHQRRAEEDRIQRERSEIHAEQEREYRERQEQLKQEALVDEQRKRSKVFPEIERQREREKLYQRELNRISDEVPRCETCKGARCTKCNHIIGPIWLKFKNEELPKIFAEQGLGEV